MAEPFSWQTGPWYRPGPPGAGGYNGADLRCSDRERAEVNDLLCRHFAEGRLDSAELEQRTAAVAAARTRRELWALLTDLPPLPGDPRLAGPPGPTPDPGRLGPTCGAAWWCAAGGGARRLVLLGLATLAIVAAIHSLHPAALLAAAVIVAWVWRRGHLWRRWARPRPAGGTGGRSGWGRPTQL